jgi:hypothetical protein
VPLRKRKAVARPGWQLDSLAIFDCPDERQLGVFPVHREVLRTSGNIVLSAPVARG